VRSSVARIDRRELQAMTAVDPQRLAREIDALGTELQNPKALRSRVVALLDIYADRTRRTVTSSNPDRAPWSFDVPAPVLRSLKQFLCERLAGRLELAWGVADELWTAGYRETQELAADILSLIENEQVAGWAEAHVAGSVESAALAALAGNGLAGWRQADPQDFLGRASLWLNGEASRMKVLAFYSLAAAVRDPSFVDLPTIYKLIAGFGRPARGEIKRALSDLVHALAQRSPAETTHFLLERMKRGVSGAKTLAREVQDSLPAPQKATIQKALSG
jgi:hypothetical protein